MKCEPPPQEGTDGRHNWKMEAGTPPPTCQIPTGGLCFLSTPTSKAYPTEYRRGCPLSPVQRLPCPRFPVSKMPTSHTSVATHFLELGSIPQSKLPKLFSELSLSLLQCLVWSPPVHSSAELKVPCAEGRCPIRSPWWLLSTAGREVHVGLTGWLDN